MRLKRALIIMGLLFLTNCASPDPAPGGELPWGQTFQSSEVIEDDQPRPLVAGTQVQLMFGQDQLTATAGCNTHSGPVHSSDGRLVFPDPAMTELGCAPDLQVQDDWLRAVLTSGPSWTYHDSELVLRTERVTLRLARVDDEHLPLLGTTWELDSLIDGDHISARPAGVNVHLVFGPDEQVTGNTGCGTITGTAVPGPGTITFAGVEATEDDCDESSRRVAAAVLAVLRDEVVAQLSGPYLTLSHPDGIGLRLRGAN